MEHDAYFNWSNLEKNWNSESPIEYRPQRIRNCVRITGDFVSGNVLYFIVEWFLKKKDGSSKLVVNKKWDDGKFHKCLAKDDKQFEVELGTTRSQTRSALKKLENELGIIKTMNKRFYGNKTRHIFLNKKVFTHYYEDARDEQKEIASADKERFKNAVTSRKNSRQIYVETNVL